MRQALSRILTSSAAILAGLVLLSCALHPSHADAATVLGVPTSKQRLYEPKGGKFECFDKLKVLDFASVNDDYCDCLDGSDEPGTSACPNSLFACKNEGYFQTTIPSSRVNDGICDCCDGSDEPQASKKCPKTCEALSASLRTQAQKILDIEKRGWEARQRLAKKGVEEKEERERKIDELYNKIEKFKKRVEHLKEVKRKAEIREQEERERELREKANRAGLTAEEEQKFCQDIDPKIENLRNSLANLKSNLEALRSKEEFTEQDIEGPLSQLRLISLDLPSLEASCAKKEAAPASSEESGIQAEPAAPVVEDDFEDEEDEEEEQAGFDWFSLFGLDQIYEDFCELSARFVCFFKNCRPVDLSDYDETESKLQAAQKTLQDLQEDLKDLERTSKLDFGEDQEFFHLHNKCFELQTPEYTYEFCPFDQASQKSKNGGSETSLGSVAAWASADGKSYRSMKFTNGLRCWNGPDRSVDVKFECGADNELVSVSEPAKCEYVMEFRTPSVCNQPRSLFFVLLEQARKKDPTVVVEKEE